MVLAVTSGGPLLLLGGECGPVMASNSMLDAARLWQAMGCKCKRAYNFRTQAGSRC